MTFIRAPISAVRRFHSIHRHQLTWTLGLRSKLPQNKKVMHWKNIPVYNNPISYFKGGVPPWVDEKDGFWRDRKNREPIPGINEDNTLVGFVNVKLLPFVPSKHKSSAHRLLIECPKCKKWIPFGRMHQHVDKGTCNKEVASLSRMTCDSPMEHPEGLSPEGPNCSVKFHPSW